LRDQDGTVEALRSARNEIGADPMIEQGLKERLVASLDRQINAAERRQMARIGKYTLQ
jgi:hypothetical protein